ncbi:hypothetical protein BDW22DRAFT_488080 [Trametopsis cervina]|nr:hypothetical protein BDW22DRAFT_488080 [Trametopsis cervina]
MAKAPNRQPPNAEAAHLLLGHPRFSPPPPPYHLFYLLTAVPFEMASVQSNAWMPTAGRYTAKVGKSLSRVIKTRKGEPLQKSKFPEPDFYSLRYNFIPPSVDSAKPGTIEVRKGKDVTSVTVERANSQTEEGAHIFAGAETVAKEVECVLIYDEELGLDSYVNLTYDRKITRAPKHPGSPLPSSRPSTSTSTSSSNAPLAQTVSKRRIQTAADQLEADLSGDEDAVGELDEDFAGVLPPEPPKKLQKEVVPPKKEKLSFTKKTKVLATPPIAVKKEEEEESEGEIKDSPPPSTKISTITSAKAVPKPKQGKSLAAAAAAIRANKAASPMTSASTSATSPQLSAPAPPNHPLPPRPVTTALAPESGRKPTKASPTKKARPSPPPKLAPARPAPKKEPPKKKEPAALAFPGAEGSSFSLDLPGPSHPSSTMPVLPGDDSENEDWDPVPQVAASPKKSPEPPVRQITMEEIIPTPPPHHDTPESTTHLDDTLTMEEEDEDEDEYDVIEIDENELQRELEAHLEGEDDEPEPEQPEPPQFSGPILSLNALAGQFVGDDDDSDDDTTSDESD